MNKNWTTKATDMFVARQIIEHYAEHHESESLGLFEVVVSEKEPQFQFRLSQWVMLIAEHFKAKYGAEQGDFVTRNVITHCLVQGQTIH